RAVPERKALCNSVHGVNHRAVRRGWNFRIQAGLSGGARFFDWLWQTVSADDHDRGIHRPVSDGDSRLGRWFLRADPGLFLISDGGGDGGLDVAEHTLFHPGNFHHCRHPHADHRHSEYVYFRRTDDWTVHFEYWYCVAGSPGAAASQGRA